jgi:hypothetical protein
MSCVEFTMHKFKLLFAGASVAVVILLGALTWFFQQHPEGKPAYEATGVNEPLFQGESLQGWSIASGAWKPDKDSKGTRVISGQGRVSYNGVLHRLVPRFPHFQIQFGVDLQQARAVQVHFGPSQGPDGGWQHVLQICPEGAVLARSTGDDDSIQSQSSYLVPYPPATNSKPQYLVVSLQRIEKHWWVQLNGKDVANVERMPHEDSDGVELRLVVAGGPAFFRELQITELVKK